MRELVVPPTNRMAPIQSVRLSFSLVVNVATAFNFIKTMVSRYPIPQRGKLIQKTQRQVVCSAMIPPITGPTMVAVVR